MKKLYNKIMGFVGGIPADKALHFIAGMFVCAIVVFCSARHRAIRLCDCVCRRAGKGGFDLFATGHFDDKDILATALGGFAMQIFIWLL